MNRDRIKRWELALALSLCITLCHALAFGGGTVGWWGVIFPGLTEGAAAETAGFGDGGVELRLRLPELLARLFA